MNATAVVDRVKTGGMAKAKGRPKNPTDGINVRLRGDVVTKARYLCARSGKPLIDYLSDLLQPEVDRQFKEAAKDVAGGPSKP